ncbi:MAG: thiolase family protein [Hyphomicrobiales bacterium]|nr:thiolase family protein [Hyphomicrobiales bacterium]
MKALIIGARRTAIGRVGGLHKARRLEALAAPLMRALLAETGLPARDVDEVALGNAAGGGGNPARLALLRAGLPESVPGVSIDRQCASGLDAILLGARLIETGAARIVLAGGAESPSTAPWRVEKPPGLYRGAPRFFEQARFAPPEIADPTMAEAAETVAREAAVSRAAMDAYALESWRRARAAQAAGRFAREIWPLAPGAAEGIDECVRPRLSAELLARMPPLIPGGTVTAGTTCQICDGAAMALLVAQDVWIGLGRPQALRFVGAAAAGVHPARLGLGPVPAAAKAFAQSGRSLADVSEVEFNEAFASQVIASLEAMGRIDAGAVNADGGALAFGHPFGASGAVIVTRLFSRMLAAGAGGGLGLATLGAAGGLGVAALFERA